MRDGLKSQEHSPWQDARAFALRAALFALCLVGTAGISLWIGQDTNWDFLNYHFYNPWAWWTGRAFYDVAPAQLQTYHSPFLDIPLYLMIAGRWPPPAIGVVMAVPAAVGMFLYALCLESLFRTYPPALRIRLRTLAFLLGVSSAMSVGMIGSSMNEWPSTAFTLGAVCVVLRMLVRRNDRIRGLMLAGVLVGIGAGLKLTYAVFAVGICAALIATKLPLGWKRAMASGWWLGAGVLCGAVTSLGPWAYALWNAFESPIFPYANELFLSEWFYPTQVLTRVYGPRTLLEAVLFPARLLGEKRQFVSQVEFTDFRLSLLFLIAAVAIIAWTWNRRGHGKNIAGSSQRDQPGYSAWLFLTVFWIVSYTVWLAMHSIYRYIIPLELLSAPLLIGALAYVLRRRLVLPAAAVLTVFLMVTTRYPDWGHQPYGAVWLDVQVPPVASPALVVTTTSSPVAFALPFFPHGTRFVAAWNNIVSPTGDYKLARHARDVIARHQGPIYSLGYPPGESSDILASHDLSISEAGCSLVATNMPVSPLELCALDRGKGIVEPLDRAVEYFNIVTTGYLLTNSPAEIRQIENEDGSPWRRTGQTIPVYTAPDAGRVPACRFVRVARATRGAVHRMVTGDSSCEDARREPGWIFQARLFYVAKAPPGGQCPPGSPRIARLERFEGPEMFDRWTVNDVVRRTEIDLGWRDNSDPGAEICAGTASSRE